MSDDFKSYISELSELMTNRPDLLDPKIIKLGKDSLAVFVDFNYGVSLPGYRELMKDLYVEAILDLAAGMPLLKKHILGVAFKNSKLMRFSVPFSESNDLGTVVSSVSLKSLKAFEKHRLEKNIELNQDELNAAIYYLINQVSML